MSYLEGVRQMTSKPGHNPLFVVSLDGVRPEFCHRASDFGVRLPNLQELVAAGASAAASRAHFRTFVSSREFIQPGTLL